MIGATPRLTGTRVLNDDTQLARVILKKFWSKKRVTSIVGSKFYTMFGEKECFLECFALFSARDACFPVLSE
jgi:hypothetical protein